MNANTRIAIVAVAVALATARAQATEPAKAASPTRIHEVKTYRNRDYCGLPGDPDQSHHRLDIYCPKEQAKYPVLFFVHGGAWTISSKDDVLGIFGYGTIAKNLAERGFVVVVPNYRLSPQVRHPEHIKDVARAFAWTCDHIGDYNGDPGQIVVAGHSAGGHLVALLATDPAYLKAVARNPKDIRGVIGISGVYNVEHLDLKQLLGVSCKGPDFYDKMNPIVSVFGPDPKVLKQASPFNHVRPGLPPFLLINGGLDYCPLRTMTKEFAAALKDNGCDVQTKVFPWRTHETMVFDIPHLSAEPKMLDAVEGFMHKTLCASTR